MTKRFDGTVDSGLHFSVSSIHTVAHTPLFGWMVITNQSDSIGQKDRESRLS